VDPSEPVDESLRFVLERSRSLGFLGTGPIVDHVAHAQPFVAAVEQAGSVLDLGSGGGLPGLVIAHRWPDLDLVLLDAQERRCAFLRWAVNHLGATKCRIVQGRAEILGGTELRGSFDVVVARSFGAPAMTAECGGAFLRVGGKLIVSEPPNNRSLERWPASGLAALGQVAGPRLETGSSRLQVIDQASPFPVVFPRNLNVMRSAPVFD